MNEPIPYRHEWLISGLSSVCDRITAHPYIKSIFFKTFEIRFYPAGYDESCREYVSLSLFNSYYSEYALDTFKISIKNDKKENLFVKEFNMEMNDEKINEYIRRDYLLDPENGLTQNDQFTLCAEVCVYWKNIIPTNFRNNTVLSRNYFDFTSLLSTKSLALKLNIENVMDLFELSDYSKIELTQFNCSTETDEVILRLRIQIIKSLHSNNRKLSFELQSDYKGLIVVETSLIDINQHKCHGQKKALEGSISGFLYNFIIDYKFYSNQSILANNRLTLFCEISIITETIKKENKFNYIQMIESIEAPSALQINECTIDGKTGEIIQNKVPLFSNIEDKEIEIEKLKEFENRITNQTSTVDQTISNVFNIYHEHYFENSNIKNSQVNAKSTPIIGNISIKSEKTACAELIEKLEYVVRSEIEPVLDQNEQIQTKMKSSKSFNADLFVEVLDKNKSLLENQHEMRKDLQEILCELNKMKHTKKVKKSKMKQIIDRIVALLNRIKYELNKVGTNISTTVTQVRQSLSTRPKPSSEPTLTKSNSAIEYIEPHTSSLIKYVKSVPTSQSISYKTKQNHIHKLETIKNFLNAHLPPENVANNSHFDVESITLENADEKLSDIIENQISDLDKKYQKLLIRLRDLFVESKSESSSDLADKVDESQNSK